MFGNYKRDVVYFYVCLCLLRNSTSHLAVTPIKELDSKIFSVV